MDDIIEEHRGIRAHLSELEEFVNERGSHTGPLKDALVAMQDELRKHFASEEMSELFVDLPQRMPEVAAKLAELKVEHGTILEHLTRIITAVGQLHEARAEVARQVNDLVSTVRDHERSEATLMQHAFLAEM